MNANLNSCTSEIHHFFSTRLEAVLPKASGGLLFKIKKAAVLLALLGAGQGPALASDPIGIYALVDRVVLEPNNTKPDRIQIWGGFCLAKRNGFEYETPRSGYLYYTLKESDAAVCRKEWADFQAVAGTGQVISFASRYEEKGRIRSAADKPAAPDVYPVAWGVQKVRRSDYKPIQDLLQYKKSPERSKKGAPAAAPAALRSQSE